MLFASPAVVTPVAGLVVVRVRFWLAACVCRPWDLRFIVPFARPIILPRDRRDALAFVEHPPLLAPRPAGRRVDQTRNDGEPERAVQHRAQQRTRPILVAVVPDASSSRWSFGRTGGAGVDENAPSAAGVSPRLIAPGGSEAGTADLEPIEIVQSVHWIRFMTVVLGMPTAAFVGFIAIVMALTALDAPSTRPPPGVVHEPMEPWMGFFLVVLGVAAIAVVLGPLLAVMVRRRRGTPQLLADLDVVQFGAEKPIPWERVGYVSVVAGRLVPRFEVAFRSRAKRPYCYTHRKIRGDGLDEFEALNHRPRDRWELLGDTSDPAKYLEKSHPSGLAG